MHAPSVEGERFAKEVELPVKDVVAQDQDRSVVADKIRADEKRLRDPFRLRLNRVFEADPELRAVAEKIAQHRNVFRGRDDEDFAQAAEHEGGERIADHRFIVNREQLFADDFRQRIKTRARAAGEEDGFFFHSECAQPINR